MPIYFFVMKFNSKQRLFVVFVFILELMAGHSRFCIIVYYNRLAPTSMPEKLLFEAVFDVKRIFGNV